MEQNAEQLFEKFLKGTCSKEELDRLMELIQQHEQEATFRLMLEKVYQQVDQSITSDIFVGTPAGVPSKNESEALWEDTARNGQLGNSPFSKNHKTAIKSIRYLIATAACLLLAMGMIYYWHITKTGQNSQEYSKIALNPSKKQQPKMTFLPGTYKHQTTNRAEQKYLLLPDGTQVWLNAESTLIIPDQFDSLKRVVYLEGEAYFDVKHADKIPFIIHMPSNVTTTVLGTAFDIKAYANQDYSVSVKRGKVLVSKDQKSLATLTVGQQIKMNVAQQLQPVVKTVKQEDIAMWKEGKLVYDALDLQDIIQDLERVYDVSIELKNNKLSNEVITTSFNRGDNLDSVLETLAVLTGTQIRKSGDVYLIQ